MAGYEISQAEWQRYTDRLRRIDKTAAELMQKYVDEHGYIVDQEMIDYAYALTTKYGEASGALSASMYDSIVDYYKAHSGSSRAIDAAVVADPATRQEVTDALYNIQHKNAQQTIPSKIGQLVRQCGADTMLQNAVRDHAEWAWIPGGGETCAFCLMLASRGWTEASSKTLKGDHAEHIHSNCDCTFAIRFDESMDIEGYDPQGIYQEFMDTGETSWDDRVNAVRRQQYQLNIEEIRAQKRAAYAKNKEIQESLNTDKES